jgi:hypothetical protein
MLHAWCVVPGRNPAGLFGGSVAFGARVAIVVALQLQSDHACMCSHAMVPRPFDSCFASKEGRRVAGIRRGIASRRDCVLIKF